MAKKKTGKQKEKKGKKVMADSKLLKQEEKRPEKPRFAFITAKRKSSVARATVRPGSGLVKINSVPLEIMKPDMVRLRIEEALMIAGDAWKKFNINIRTTGGGFMGQADAARQAIAKGLVNMTGGDLKQRYMDYDRNFLVTDPRRTESHKPPRSSQGPRRYKQRSKR